MLCFLPAVGFSQTPVILPLLRRFRNFANSDYSLLSVYLSVRTEQLSSHMNNFNQFDILGYFELVLRNFNFNINARRIMGTDMET